jgi:ABC-2 type transport system permease protein
VKASELPRLYVTQISATMKSQVQHRVALVTTLVTFMIEPVVYLTVWRTVAQQNGGSLSGFSQSDLAAYFIVWGLVRVVNIAYNPTSFQWRIQNGSFSAQLLKPMHPIHYDLAWFAGLKIPLVAAWVPVALVMGTAFRPTFTLEPFKALLFITSLIMAYLVRSLYLWIAGLVNFWTNRTTAVYEGIIVLELLFSGRFAPLPLLPDWIVGASRYLPFYATFGMPIDILLRDIDGAPLFALLTVQAWWLFVLISVMLLVWKRAIKRYTAVGG